MAGMVYQQKEIPIRVIELAWRRPKLCVIMAMGDLPLP